MKLTAREKALVEATTERVLEHLKTELAGEIDELLGMLDDLGAICEAQGNRIDVLEAALGLAGQCDCPKCRGARMVN